MQLHAVPQVVTVVAVALATLPGYGVRGNQQLPDTTSLPTTPTGQLPKHNSSDKEENRKLLRRALQSDTNKSVTIVLWILPVAVVAIVVVTVCILCRKFRQNTANSEVPELQNLQNNGASLNNGVGGTSHQETMC